MPDRAKYISSVLLLWRQLVHGMRWPYKWHKKLADASLESQKTSGKQSSCSIAFPQLFKQGMQSLPENHNHQVIASSTFFLLPCYFNATKTETYKTWNKMLSRQLTLMSSSNSKVFFTPSPWVNCRADTTGTDEMVDLAPANGESFWIAWWCSCHPQFVIKFQQAILFCFYYYCKDDNYRFF